MRKSVLLLAPLALAASPAFAAADADGSTGQVDITGSVAGRCLFTTPSQTLPLGELALGGTDTNAGKLNAGAVNTKNRTLVGWCNNAAAEMTVEATALTNSAAAASGFTNRVDYTATAAANNTSANDTTLTDGQGAKADVGMFTGNVVVTLSSASAPSNNLLVAGAYSGNVKVYLNPKFTLPQL